MLLADWPCCLFGPSPVVVPAARVSSNSIPSPRARLSVHDRKISFADVLGRDLEEVNFCENLHYSKQKKKWFFFS
jgi:hypothetical protein